jgi:hypothetical protein
MHGATFARAAVKTLLFFAFSALLMSGVAQAQTILSGTVTDSSGGVLPGVTVEAASPALIEKVRTATTDTNGQYRLVDLRPGLYKVTFTLPGFTTVARENVEVSGNQTIQIGAEMRVGAVQETITVTGETPVVDVQSTRRVATVDGETVASIPIARGYGNLLATVPGIQLNTTTSQTGIASSFFTSNGGNSNEGRIQIAGMNVGSAFNGGGVAAFSYPVAESQEIQVTVSGGLGEADTGGPAMNIIPREGGNRFAGTAFLSEAGEWSQGDNLTDELRSPPISITQPAGLVRNWDESFAMGGPIVRDRLWFYAMARDNGTMSNVLGNDQTTFPNLNAGNRSSWVYAPDRSTDLRSASSAKQVAFRLTGQVGRHKLGFYHDYNWDCWSSSLNDDGCRPRGEDWIALGNSGSAPETGTGWDGREKIIQATYSSVLTNKLLLEGGYSTFISAWGGFPVQGNLLDFERVTEQSNYYGVANYQYRGLTSYTHNEQMPNVWRGSLSYVTGSHNIKIGNQGAYHIAATFADTVGSTQLNYTFNSLCQLPGEPAPVAPGAGVRPCTAALGGTIVPRPIQATTTIPNYNDDRTTFEAFYVQDQWTINRLTVNAALRYEWAKSWAPEGKNGVIANRWTPAILDPRTEGVTGYHDISPRVGVAYDVFGTGKTAVRFNVGHYLAPANNEQNYTINNPAVGRTTTQTRNWTDRDGDFVVDCDLSPTTIAAQDVPGGDICGPVTGAGLNFGSVVRTRTVNPDVLHGWGVRPYDWVTTASIQQEIIPRLSVELSYNRRHWGNFFVDDNLNLAPSDFDVATIAAPSNTLLPDGGGYPVSFYVPRVSAAVRNYYTFASDYGERKAMYHSYQVTARARTEWGLTLQGGTTTGRGVRDTCELQEELPELNITGANVTNYPRVDSCHVTEDWLTSLNGLATYTVPKIDVLVSAIMRSQPGTAPGGTVGSGGGSLAANYNVTNQQIFNAVGHNLVACAPGTAPAACTSVQSVNLLLNGEVYQKRLNSFDMRFAKILRFGGRRADIGIDLYNIINANTQTGYNQAYGNDGTGLFRPTTIQGARFARFNVRFDF